jgi:hypothetical protein
VHPEAFVDAFSEAHQQLGQPVWAANLGADFAASSASGEFSN